jgi:hypothetical protein
MTIPGPWTPADSQRFFDTYLYQREGFLVDEILKVDDEAKTISARMDTSRRLPVSSLVRDIPGVHPAHVTGPELIMLTGNLGSLHAWFHHGLRWDEGWGGFGSRIQRADFRSLISIGPPLRLESKETRTRKGPKQVVCRYEFEFSQEDTLVYKSEQSAIFVLNMKA